MAVPEIQVTNSLGGQKQPFKPLVAGQVSIYACGVTTYDHYHIGHALQAIFFDVIRNYLEYVGYKVIYVRNYTDVDDKIINRAQQVGVSPAQLAQTMIDSSEEDMQGIGCRAPTHAPRVSQMIPQIIAMIVTLIEKNAAYATAAGDVYYRVRAKADYGKLSNRRTDECLTNTRGTVADGKEDDLDFALWKSDTTPSASWPSPWGQGRPGWHIECSAMAKEFLGSSFDFHGGGLDLIFPHHENEIAQSESANGAPYASYWLHSGLLTIEKQKMSKSLGNHITVKDFLKKWPREALRLAFLQQHYRSNIDFHKNTFVTAHKRLSYYYATLAELDELAKKASGGTVQSGLAPDDVRTAFKNAMNDDFNSALALAELNRFFKKAKELIASKNSPEKSATAQALASTFREVAGVFGILQGEPRPTLRVLRTMLLPEMAITEAEITAAIQARQQARQNKDFAAADKIRAELAARGIEMMDTPQGTDWKIKFDE